MGYGTDCCRHSNILDHAIKKPSITWFKCYLSPRLYKNGIDHVLGICFLAPAYAGKKDRIEVLLTTLGKQIGAFVDIKDFKAGSYRKGSEYLYFLPEKVNNSFFWTDKVINELLEKASFKLGELNSFSRFVPDTDMFIMMHIFKEAVVSSSRGERKNPGEFRKSQNWIGGASLTDAVFIPPVYTELTDLMSDLEFFLHNSEIKVPHLVKIAIAHYQFETIHPFLDGNGRIGRLLITLYLVSSGILDKSLLSLSEFFEKNKTLYYDNLTFVRTKNDIGQWIKFFLTGVLLSSFNRNRVFVFDEYVRMF